MNWVLFDQQPSGRILRVASPWLQAAGLSHLLRFAAIEPLRRGGKKSQVAIRATDPKSKMFARTPMPTEFN
jgi:hypothetical protein